MALPAEKIQYTFADCLAWNEDEHIEIIHGEAFMIAAPSTAHQMISGEIFRQLASFLEGKKCIAIPAPFSVRLFEQDKDAPEDVDTIVEPDISVICDRNKLDRHGCKGVPDMVIEILSPSSLRHDRLVKLNLYQQAGVREYWIVDPQNQAIQVFLPDDNGFLRICEEYGPKDVAKVNVLDGCFIDLNKIYANL